MNAAHIHLVLNHVPILGFGFALFLLVWSRWKKSDEVARAALTLMFLVGLTSLAVFFTGEGAEEVVEGMAGVSHDAIEAHEEVGELAMVISMIVGLASGAAVLAFWKKAIPGWVAGVSLLASAVAFAVLVYTGFQGGQIHHEEIRPAGVATAGMTAPDVASAMPSIGIPARALGAPGAARVIATPTPEGPIG